MLKDCTNTPIGCTIASTNLYIGQSIVQREQLTLKKFEQTRDIK